MDLRFQQRGATGLALFLALSPLRADITLPTAPPPQADAQAIHIVRGDRTTIPLRGHHGGSGAITFWIVQHPRHGRLSDLRLLGDNRATIVYQHDPAEASSTDRFSYLVQTNADRVSSPAEVRILVEERPARLQVPARIEFEGVMAGESMTRRLTISNEGGGVLEGRLAASAPWRLGSTHYRVASGENENVAVVFQPDEPRNFVGQITLIASGGALRSVMLEGSAVSPVAFQPAEVRIGRAKEEDGLRAASVALTNRTDRNLQLKFSASRSFKPIADLALAPSQKKEIAIVLAPERTLPVDEAIIVRGESFCARLPVAADPCRRSRTQTVPIQLRGLLRPRRALPPPCLCRANKTSLGQKQPLP